jgi:hypothetical protein
VGNRHGLAAFGLALYTISRQAVIGMQVLRLQNLGTQHQHHHGREDPAVVLL